MGTLLGRASILPQDWVTLRPGRYREVCFLATKKMRTQSGSVWSTELSSVGDKRRMKRIGFVYSCSMHFDRSFSTEAVIFAWFPTPSEPNI